LHGLTGLKRVDYRNNSSLSEPEIERFQKAVSSCQVNS